MELENGITLENLLLQRKVFKDYWLIPDKVKVRFSSITLKEQMALKVDSTIFGDQRTSTIKMLASSLEQYDLIDGDKVTSALINADLDSKIKFLESLPTQIIAKMIELLNQFDSEIMKLFEESKKN
ncbi:MAG: hypothetical protein QXP66_01785 [Candidatus Aenigmatarchaeota archaeon]